MADSDQAPVAVVTGASRGIGRGIATVLGSHGCTVYVTGRSQQLGQTEDLPGTIYETAETVTAAGGKGIAVVCDHADDEQTKAVFDKVAKEQGRLDILVNNAAKTTDAVTEPGPFWEKPLDLANVINVGLRSAYVCCYYAAPMMVEQQHGLILFTGSQGGQYYFMGPGYGAHKAGEDKFAYDMGYELKDHGVAVVCIWCGGVLTDRTKRIFGSDPQAYAGIEEMLETPQFTGHVMWALYNDPKLMERSGKSWIGAELAIEYGIKDEGDRQPPNMREWLGMAPRNQSWPT